MGEIDTKMWIDVRRYAARLRRRMWYCQLGMIAAPLLMAPLFAFWQEFSRFVQGVLIAAFVPAVSACLVVGNATWFELIGFRCPRCGQYFISPFWIGFYSKRCKHCGLDLGRGAIAKEKPLDLADL